MNDSKPSYNPALIEKPTPQKDDNDSLFGDEDKNDISDIQKEPAEENDDVDGLL